MWFGARVQSLLVEPRSLFNPDDIEWGFHKIRGNVVGAPIARVIINVGEAMLRPPAIYDKYQHRLIQYLWSSSRHIVLFGGAFDLVISTYNPQ